MVKPSCYTRPHREPDFVVEDWEFFIEEGLQYNTEIKNWFVIRHYKGQLQYELSNKTFTPYPDKFVKQINEKFINFLIEKDLLE